MFRPGHTLASSPWPVSIFTVLALVAPLLPCLAASPNREEVGALQFCFSDSAMPRSGRATDGSPQGVDVAVARRIAAHLQRSVELHWCGSDDCRLNSLRAGSCDVVIGLPHESVKSSDIAWTAPYASGKFGLLVNRDEAGVHSLRDLRGKRVGIVTGTIVLSEKDHSLVRFRSREALLRGFRQGELDGALVDVDFAAWYLRARPELELRLVDEFVSQYRWSNGIAVRAGDGKLREQISRAIENCLQRAEFTPIFAEFGLTHRAPLIGAGTVQNAVATSTWRRVKAGSTLTVSFDPANLPYSSADPNRPGFDVELARALGTELGVAIDIEWFDVHRETALGELLDGHCDLAFGAAVDANAMENEETLDGKVIYSRPYYVTGYQIVARSNVPRIRSLEELQGPASRRLGTQAGTIADYALRQRGYQRRLFGTQLAVLKAIDDGDIDYGYLWSNIGWVIHNSPDFHVALLPDYTPDERWPIAIAMRPGDVELREHVDRAVGALLDKEVVQDALGRYHVPFLAPSDKQAQLLPGKNDPAVRLKPLDRGLEPQMARRQHSKQSYAGLQKIRSRGTLVVGLDQNNLPFSSAHPRPAGLDYEIADLIASELGVKLAVFWAYSSHDSYPSKLAHKELCDIMMGVMPDDRFADQVLYSDPYFHAGYQYAVRVDQTASSNDGWLEAGSVGVEEGVAVQAVEGKHLRHFGSLAGVLEAVATGEIQAGYVISSRAPWLAEQQWPGKLKFNSSSSSADRFPVCVALRRSEPDAKAAIDAALAELRRSGKLQEVFVRWHVPIDSIQVQ